jgi:hypothetical protein
MTGQLQDVNLCQKVPTNIGLEVLLRIFTADTNSRSHYLAKLFGQHDATRSCYARGQDLSHWSMFLTSKTYLFPEPAISLHTLSATYGGRFPAHNGYGFCVLAV